MESAAYGAGAQRPEVDGRVALRRGVFDSVLDLFAVLVSGKAVLPNAHPSDFYVTGLGALVTIVYMGGLLFNPAPPGRSDGNR